MATSTQEPLHADRQSAVKWVHEYTDNVCFRDHETETTVRVDASTESVLHLRQAEDGTFYWKNMRQIH